MQMVIHASTSHHHEFLGAYETFLETYPYLKR